ncbi:hypothetical protein [Methanospirillum lacunae]|nr:hypothetical protein [Methanospirillum lacunae]
MTKTYGIFSSPGKDRKRTRPSRILLTGVLIIVLCIAHASSLPTILFPLKDSPATGPYQDDEFLTLASSAIYGLSNATIPNGTELRDLQSTQQKLAKMNISPDFYEKARKINAYLYYTAQAGDAYSDAMSLSGKAYSPVYEDPSALSEVQEYQAASKTMWNQIQDLFPGVEPYRITTEEKPFSVNEDPTFKQPNNPFSSYTEEDAIYDQYYR